MHFVLEEVFQIAEILSLLVNSPAVNYFGTGEAQKYFFNHT